MKPYDKLTLIGVLAITLGIQFGFIAGYLSENYELPMWVPILNAFVLILVFCTAAYTFWRAAALDELQSLIRLRGLAISAVIMFAVIMVIWALEINGLLRADVNINMMIFIMYFSYIAGFVIANWKYRIVEDKKDRSAENHQHAHLSR